MYELSPEVNKLSLLAEAQGSLTPNHFDLFRDKFETSSLYGHVFARNMNLYLYFDFHPIYPMSLIGLGVVGQSDCIT